MANNRMLLIHRPTGLAVVIGKHMGWGWYRPPEKETLELLYDEVQKRTSSMADMEDFCLGMESCAAKTPFVRTDWRGYYRDNDEPLLLQVNEPRKPSASIMTLTAVPGGDTADPAVAMARSRRARSARRIRNRASPTGGSAKGTPSAAAIRSGGKS